MTCRTPILVVLEGGRVAEPDADEPELELVEDEPELEALPEPPPPSTGPGRRRRSFLSHGRRAA